MADRTQSLPKLIEAEPTALNVRSREGDKHGHVKALMIDKQTDQARYAVLSLGRFLGINKSFYPVPFELIAYDRNEDDYVVTLNRRMLEGDPSLISNPPEFNQSYADRESSYYGTAPRQYPKARTGGGRSKGATQRPSVGMLTRFPQCLQWTASASCRNKPHCSH